MEISSNVARVSGLGEPVMYAAPIYNTQTVEKVEAIEARNYKPKYPSDETKTQAQAIESDPKSKANYKPGDLVNLYA
ncbi:hypothetical protein P3G55_16870 [Leptospira sp. 96542]|nr:hypothetical protein [Leptospira sp. 96542]